MEPVVWLGSTSELTFVLWLVFVFLKLALAQWVFVTGWGGVPILSRVCGAASAVAFGLAAALGIQSNKLFVEPNSLIPDINSLLGALRIGMRGFSIAEVGDVLLVLALVLIFMRSRGVDVAS